MRLKEQCILGIEGSGFSVSIGLMVRSEPRGNLYLNTGAPGSESLLLGIDRLLKLVDVDKGELEGICVTLGPGSFTSLRVCLSTAEALGLGLGIPVYGVDSLILVAATVPFFPFHVKVLQNAYKGEFYTAVYDTSGGRPSPLSEPGLIQPAVFFERLQRGELVLGNGADRLLAQGFNLAKKGVHWDNSFHRLVSGIAVVEHFLETEALEPADLPLEPIYIRLSEAELNYARQFGKT